MKDIQSHYKVSWKPSSRWFLPVFPEHLSLFLGTPERADSQPWINKGLVFAFQQFTIGKKATCTIPFDEFRRYRGCRINAQGTTGTGHQKRLHKGSKPVLGFEGWVRTCQAESESGNRACGNHYAKAWRVKGLGNSILSYHTTCTQQEQEIRQKQACTRSQRATGTRLHRPGGARGAFSVGEWHAQTSDLRQKLQSGEWTK